MLRVRRACPADAESIALLEQRCFRSPWSLRSVLEELEDPDAACFLVAEEDGMVKGYLGSWMLPPFECQIGNVAVDPECRRQGIARKLLQALLGECADRDIPDITLEVRTSNAPAIALYESFGFAEEGRRKKYYENTEDAIIMWRRG